MININRKKISKVDKKIDKLIDMFKRANIIHIPGKCAFIPKSVKLIDYIDILDDYENTSVLINSKPAHLIESGEIVISIYGRTYNKTYLETCLIEKNTIRMSTAGDVYELFEGNPVV